VARGKSTERLNMEQLAWQIPVGLIVIVVGVKIALDFLFD
jgi:hypothetical protein